VSNWFTRVKARQPGGLVAKKSNGGVWYLPGRREQGQRKGLQARNKTILQQLSHERDGVREFQKTETALRISLACADIVMGYTSQKLITEKPNIDRTRGKRFLRASATREEAAFC